MQNLVNFFCPVRLVSEINEKEETFRAEVEDFLQKQKAVTTATQVLVFHASYGTMGANRVMVLCTNNAIVDGFLIKVAIEAALETVYPKVWKEKRFVVLQLPRQK